jgi:anti-sigma B factor antagonist
MIMEITTISYNRCGLVKAIGRIDSETAPDLQKAFNSIIESGKAGIAFDMSEVDFISSRGIWVLLETQKVCSKKKGKLVLVNVADEMLKSFDLVGVKHFIEIYNDVTAAVGSF